MSDDAYAVLRREWGAEIERLSDALSEANARGVQTTEALLRCMRERVSPEVHAEVVADRDALRARVESLTADLILLRHRCEHSGAPRIQAGPIADCKAEVCIEAVAANPLLTLLVAGGPSVATERGCEFGCHVDPADHPVAGGDKGMG